MTAIAIQVHGLRKVYRRRWRPPVVAVDGLDLTVPQGCVFGLLGPNGSGKTTTLRCLLGLATPTGGTCRLLGADCQTQLHRVIGQVGAVTDTPGFHPAFTARTSLALLGRLDRISPDRVAWVLERVGLADRADDPIRGYSFGMRQRLGVAAALLNDPAVLILDEPAGGLDPAGIIWVRGLLRELAAEGRAVLVASHLLGELEHACDQVAVLAGGRVLAAGPLDELLATVGIAGTGSPALLVRLGVPAQGQDLAELREAGIPTMLVGNADQVTEPQAGQAARVSHVLAAAALAALRDVGIPATLAADGDALHVALPATEAATVSRTLAAAGLYPSELRPAQPARAGLEAAFLALTRARTTTTDQNDQDQDRPSP